MSFGLIRNDVRDRGGDVGGTVIDDAGSARFEFPPNVGAARRDDRRPAGHRLSQHQPEVLLVSWQDEDVGRLVQRTFLDALNHAEEMRRASYAYLFGQRLEGIDVMRLAGTADQKLYRRRRRAQHRCGADQQLDAFLRMNATEEEDLRGVAADCREGAKRKLGTG